VLAIMKTDKTDVRALGSGKTKMERGYGEGWGSFDDIDFEDLKKKYHLSDGDSIFGRVVLKVPISAFWYPFIPPFGNAGACWLSKIFERIEDPAKAVHSNVKLISSDGRVFYCDKVVLGAQSDFFEAMFRHKPPPNAVENEYPMPNISGVALKALLEYIYKGLAVVLVHLPTRDIIQVADASEQHGFEDLMKICGSSLWKRVADKPEDCFEVVRFADTFASRHKYLKYLKYRAMDILAENWDNIEVQSASFGDDDGIGSRLRDEFNTFCCRRILPTFHEE